MDTQALKDSLTDAIGFWEPRRVIYNVVLAGIVCLYFWRGLPSSKTLLDVNFALSAFVLAVLANICYCAAYLPDIFIQMSDFRHAWRRIRWILFVVGTVFAATITRFIAMGFFAKN